nr:immunoglobulin heavy chain junction region [Mus musculus]
CVRRAGTTVVAWYFDVW